VVSMTIQKLRNEHKSQIKKLRNEHRTSRQSARHGPAPPPTCRLGGVDLLSNRGHVTQKRRCERCDSDTTQIMPFLRFSTVGRRSSGVYFFNSFSCLDKDLILGEHAAMRKDRQITSASIAVAYTLDSAHVRTGLRCVVPDQECTLSVACRQGPPWGSAPAERGCTAGAAAAWSSDTTAAQIGSAARTPPAAGLAPDGGEMGGLPG
jgi:hypothetical protein